MSRTRQALLAAVLAVAAAGGGVAAWRATRPSPIVPGGRSYGSASAIVNDLADHDFTCKSSYSVTPITVAQLAVDSVDCVWDTRLNDVLVDRFDSTFRRDAEFWATRRLPGGPAVLGPDWLVLCPDMATAQKVRAAIGGSIRQ